MRIHCVAISRHQPLRNCYWMPHGTRHLAAILAVPDQRCVLGLRRELRVWTGDYSIAVVSSVLRVGEGIEGFKVGSPWVLLAKLP